MAFHPVMLNADPKVEFSEIPRSIILSVVRVKIHLHFKMLVLMGLKATYHPIQHEAFNVLHSLYKRLTTAANYIQKSCTEKFYTQETVRPV